MIKDVIWSIIGLVIIGAIFGPGAAIVVGGLFAALMLVMGFCWLILNGW